MTGGRVLPAAALAALAFLLYRATLLPGLDFGDSASFQVVVGSPIVSTRDGYPLYFAIAGALFRVIGGDPAHALNLITAIESAAACGMLTLLAARLSGSRLAALAGALLFAGSYTFWSQAVIAEVYGLHMLLVSLVIWLLLRWEARPTLARLSLFFAVFALGFGNHLAMILLAPACLLFLLVAAPHGWRSMLRPRVVSMAVVLAAAGALQYAWNLRTLWFAAMPPEGLLSAIGAGWFDITKADWRETMVMNVPRGLLGDRAMMYLFDLRQQFGWPGVALAAVGLGALCAGRWRHGALVGGVYLVNALFAFSYNVGDAHVFYLPSHLAVALLVAPGLVFLAKLAGHPRALPILSALTLAYAGYRIHHDYPALDRSADRRPTEALDRLTSGLDDRRGILLADLNWQVENGLNYYAKVLHPEIAYARVSDVLAYAPALVRDNAAIGRNVAATPRAQAALSRAYGPFIQTARDPSIRWPDIQGATAGLPPGTRYVLSVLKPPRDYALDVASVARAAQALTAGRLREVPAGDYVVIAGVVGRAATLVAAANRPFRQTVQLDGTTVEVRMDSWLAFDTIRRMGFGHVIAGRHHSLIVERGVSFVALDPSGAPMRAEYAAGIFAGEPRYLCYR